MPNRRRFLARAGASLVALPFAATKRVLATQAARRDGAARATETASRPPSLTLNVRDFGATGNGTTKDTVAIQQALDRCAVLGGGDVRMPSGNYLTGAIALRSNTVLRLEQGTTITGTPDFADYPVTQVRWEGKWIRGHAALIYAIDARRIGVIGPGRIVGNPALGGRPTAQNPLRHPALIEPIGCDEVRLEGFAAEYRLMWCVHPANCDNVAISGLTIRTTGGNGDGIDIDSCRHVRIDGCDIASGDDCIAIKSGRGSEAYRLMRTTEDVHITNCTLADSIFACIGIGSETSGGIRNVRIERCKFVGAQTFAVYIKTRPGRGAFIEDIVATDLEVGKVAGGFLRINALNSGLQDEAPVGGDEGIPTLRNFSFSRVRVTDCPVLVDAASIHPARPLDRFTLSDVNGTARKGIALANMRNVAIRDIKVTGIEGPLVSTSNVTGKGIDGAAMLPPTKVPDPVPPAATPYQLR
jgi:polygalacturonase